MSAPPIRKLTPELLEQHISELRRDTSFAGCFNKPNPYTGVLITSWFDYEEYLKMRAIRKHYCDEYDKRIDVLINHIAIKDATLKKALPVNEDLKHELTVLINANDEYRTIVFQNEATIDEQSKKITAYESTVKGLQTDVSSWQHKAKLRPWLSAILAVIITCCIFLIGVIPSNKRAADSYALQQYDAGYSSGKSDGYTSGKSDGYDKGYAAGTDDGYKDGWQKGYESGTRRSNSVANMPKYTPPDTSTTTSDVVYVTRSGSKYHKAGCSYLKSSYEMSRSEAIAAGYEPCSRCKP